jgi:anti-repressor protein
MVMMTMQLPGDDQVREVTSIPLRKLTGWLMGLQPSRMEGGVASRVLLYQNECDDALWSYWKNGVAVNPRAITADPTLLGLPDFNDPIAAAEGWLLEAKGRRAAEARVIAAQSEVKQLAAKVEADAPRVAFAEQIERVPETIPVGLMAKLIYQHTGYDIGQNRFFEYLRAHRFVHASGDQRNMPTQRSLDAGWFKVKVKSWKDRNGDVHESQTTQVTGRGQVYFAHLFAELKKAEDQARQELPLAIFAHPLQRN